MSPNRPFVDGGQVWRDQGWPNTLPLPRQKKTYPPGGYTGKEGRSPTREDIAAWERSKAGGNLAVRLQRGTCGLDVDAYKPEGKASFDHLLAKCGPLPPTWTSTSRSDGLSGIRLYRIPEGAVLKGAPMPGIEIVQFHHRYVIVRPSIHPSGDTYQLLSPDGERADIPPRPEDLPELPAAWLVELTEHAREPGRRRERRHVRHDMPKPVKEVLADAIIDMGHEGGRHDAACRAVLALVRFERLDYPGAADALETLRSAFTNAVSDRSSAKEADKEWDSLVTSAEDEVRTTPSSTPHWTELERKREERERRRGGAQVNAEPDPEPDEPGQAVVLEMTHPDEDPPPELGDDAYYGIVEEWLRTVEPHTPAPAGPLLAQFLTVAGIYYGPRAYYEVGATRHYPRCYVGVVGATGAGRKGDGFAVVRDLFRRVDPEWSVQQVISGISSGEGLINRLADPTPDPVTGLSEPPPDKRVVVREAELRKLLSQANREGNILADTVRDAWDEFGDLAVLTRNQPLSARNTHVGIIGHITPVELAAKSTDLDAYNGLFNRFMWFHSEQTSRMPRPPALNEVAGPQLDEIALAVRAALDGAGLGRVELSKAAAELWDSKYGTITGDGIIEPLMARADPYMLRVALIYAILDGCDRIDTDHLRAAYAVGAYWLATVKRQWAYGLTDDGAKLLALCREVRSAGVSVRRHRASLSGGVDAARLERIRGELVKAGLAVVAQVKTTGRPATVVWAVEHAPEDVLPGRVESPGKVS